MEYEPERSTKSKLSVQVVVALIGALALIIVAFITYWKDRDIAMIPISATQTAEAKLTQIALGVLTPSTATSVPSRTSTLKSTDTPRPTATSNLGIGSSRISPVDGATMMYVPVGEFLMGSGDADINAQDDEKPQHKVKLDAFWIDKYELTNALYKKCVDAGVCVPPSQNNSFTRSSYYGNTRYENYPVVYVSWDEATKYCSWAKKRLPSEAEWEKAARGVDASIYPWGDRFDLQKLNSSESKVGDTTEVGVYLNGASPYGVMDMVGNVGEWVSDFYDGSYYYNLYVNNPIGPLSGFYRVWRGGSWYFDMRIARSSSREFLRSFARANFIGFRCVE